MTEKTANTRRKEIYVIDPVAFFGALVASPIAVAICGFWALGIPIFAIFFGGPFYVAIGVPVLLVYLARYQPNAWRIAGLALMSYAIPTACFLAYLYLTGSQGTAQKLGLFITFGFVFAPLWGGVFGLFYRKFRREMYTHPVEI